MATTTVPTAPVTSQTTLAGSPRLISLRVRLGMLLGTVAALAVAIPTLLHAVVLLSHLETGVVDVHFPVDEAHAPLTAQLAQAGSFALGAFAIALLTGLIVARRVTEPLLTLLRAMRSIREGEEYPSLPRSSTTELAWLADELGAMRAALDSRTVAMRQALATLDRYRLLAERLNDIVLFIDEDRIIVDANQAAERAYGYERSALIGRSVYDLLGAPEDRLTDEQLERAYHEGLVFETTHRRRDGTTFPAEVTTIGATEAGPGTPRTRVAIVRDIGVRRAVEAARARILVREQEIRAHEERAAEVTSIVQHMPCGVLVFDKDACMTLANERALEMLSPEPSDSDAVPGSPFVPHPSDMLEDRLLGPCRALVARALGGSIVGDRELEDVRPGTRDRVLVGSAAPLRSAQGEVQGAVVIVTDLTRERRLMQDLVQSEGTLRHSLESLLVLHEAGQALSSTLVEEEIGRRLVESCVRIARLDAALVFLDHGQSDARLLGAHGDPLLVDHVLTCDKSRRSRRFVARFPSSTGMSPVPPCPEMPGATGYHIELVARGRTLGVLEIYGTEQLGAVTEDALASLAAHAVSAFENAHLYREVGDREQRLQDALRQLLIAQEEERRRVAYELHDGLAQVAAATHLSLQTFASQYRSRSEQRRQQLDRSVDLARRVVREARQVIAGLRPTVLDDFGLERALRLHVKELVADGWSIEYDAQLGSTRLPGPAETVLYRIAQEALTNVRKHAQTLTATVCLRREDGYVELGVTDRGVGFSLTGPSDSIGPGQQIGLVGMRERAALVGGRCVVQSQPGTGTHVTVRIPLPEEPAMEPVPAHEEAIRHAS